VAYIGFARDRLPGAASRPPATGLSAAAGSLPPTRGGRQGQAPDHGCRRPRGPASLRSGPPQRRPGPRDRGAGREGHRGDGTGMAPVIFRRIHVSAAVTGACSGHVLLAIFLPLLQAVRCCRPSAVLAPQAFRRPGRRVRQRVLAQHRSAAEGGQGYLPGLAGRGGVVPAQAGRCRGWRRAGPGSSAAHRPSRPGQHQAAGQQVGGWRRYRPGAVPGAWSSGMRTMWLRCCRP